MENEGLKEPDKMADEPKGSFAPLEKVLPNPNEPDWEAPLDVLHPQNFDETSEEVYTASEAHNGSGDGLNSEKIFAALSTVERILNSKIDIINRQGAELFRSSNYQEALSKAEHGKNLTIFVNKVSELHNDWIFLSKELGALGERNQSESKPSGRNRRAPVKLAVRFEDGESIFESSAAETFCKTLVKIGIQRVEALGIQRLNHPLISNSPPEKKYTSNQVGDHYIITHFNTDDKRKLLLHIAEQLGISLEAEIVS
jgi:hypothetical protein